MLFVVHVGGPLNTPEQPSPHSSWLPITAVNAVVVVIGAIILTSGDKDPLSVAATTTVVAAAPSTIAATSIEPTSTVPPIAKTTLANRIKTGSSGDDVRQVQQRLTALGFAPGPIDGQFGSGTKQAVWAYEKLVLRTPRADATGAVTNEMWQGMQDNLVISPRRTVANGSGATHMEIYLPEQVAAVFTNDIPVLIAHISTGVEKADRTPETWCETITIDTDENGVALEAPVEKAVCAEAKTPGGVFKFYRRYDGKRIGPLGGMTNPVYFNYGIAVHGADNVPLEPASHGCVRLNQTIAKFFPSLVAKGDLVYVWGEDGRNPEQYSKAESLPSFNRRDPNATTTTTIAPTTTTIAPTTVPKVTVPPTTTSATSPPTTTTTSTTTTSNPVATTTTSAG